MKYVKLKDPKQIYAMGYTIEDADDFGDYVRLVKPTHSVTVANTMWNEPHMVVSGHTVPSQFVQAFPQLFEEVEAPTKE